MNRLLFWIVTAVAVTSLFIGVQAAGGVARAISGTAGSTAGLLVGQIPTFVGSFKSGMTAGTGTGGGGKGTSGTSWTGGLSNWTGTPTQPRAHRSHRPQTQPAKAHHRRHPKPNV